MNERHLFSALTQNCSDNAWELQKMLTRECEHCHEFFKPRRQGDESCDLCDINIRHATQTVAKCQSFRDGQKDSKRYKVRHNREGKMRNAL